MMLLIDPLFKIMVEERARALDTGGFTSTSIKASQLLSRVDLLNSVVACLSRIHNENETRKTVITRSRRARGFPRPSEAFLPNVVTSSLESTIPVVLGDNYDLPSLKSLFHASLPDEHDAGMNRQSNGASETPKQVSFDWPVESSQSEGTFLDLSNHGDEGRATKRLKT